MSDRRKNIKIVKQKILLVEGKDEINFFDTLLKHIGISEVQIIEVGGKKKFKMEFDALTKFNEFDDVKTYAIIQDADRNSNDTYKSIINILKEYEQPFPEKLNKFSGKTGEKYVGVFILPGNREEGMLENLCLKSVVDDPVMSCVEDYIVCLEAKLEKKDINITEIKNKNYFPKNPAKAKVQTFLAGKYEIAHSIGIAAQKGYWNLDHESLDEIKAFLMYFK